MLSPNITTGDARGFYLRQTIASCCFLLLGYALLKFGLATGLDLQFAIFGPIVGLGTAFVLVFGKQSIIPLLIASLLIQMLQLFDQNQAFSLAISYRIGATATFFALLSFLNAKVFTRLDKVYHESDIKGAIAFFLASMLSAILGITFAIFLLSLFADLNISDMPLFIGIAAFGQYIGSILCIPLIKGLFSRNENFDNHYIKGIALPLWAVFLFLFFFLSLLNRESEKKLKIEFQKISIQIGDLIEAQFFAQDAFIDGVGSFFSTKRTPVTEDHFKNYVAHGLIRYPMIQGISWLPYLTPQQLPEFIRNQRKIYSDYEVKAIGSGEKLVPDGVRRFYTPVAFIEPFNVNKRALGFDISSNPVRLEAVEKALSGFRTVASAPVKLVQDQGSKTGILLLKYVPNSKNGPGFVSEVLRLEDFIGLTTARLSEDANIRVVDADSKSVIFNNHFDSSNLAISTPLIFGGRVFDIDVSPTTEFMATHNPVKYKFFMSALIALILSIFNSFLLLISRFQQKIQEKVIEKTEELNKNEQQLRYVLAATGDGIWDWDIQSGTVNHNQRWLELLSLDPSKISSTVDDYKSRIYPEDLPKVFESINIAMQTGEKYSLEYRMIRGDESLVWVSDIGMVVDRSPSGEPLRMVGAITDITKQRDSQAKIEELAFFDPVTNLPNRRYIQDRIQRSISESSRNNSFAGLMLLDLDNFKFVNDSHGHYAGDVLLKQFGLRLGSALRPMDVVARIGGDEFLVLFEAHYPSMEQCKEILQLVINRICDQLQGVFEIERNIQVNIKPSIGVVIFGQEISGFEEVMKFADLAMYSNKSNPAERYRFYDQSLHDEFLQMSEMSSGLLEACALEQFYVDYQPVVNRAKETVAFEALARWNHPKLGKVMPDKFIPFAEKNGQIRAVGEAIFKKIFSSPQVTQLKQSAMPCSLMINLSGIHLMDANFADDFLSTANHFGFPLNLIHLEVTEGVFLDDKERSIQTMQILRDKGVKFALDDFGTGYSSFSYLQKLPINYLKIDKSFVAGMDQIGDLSIVKNIINLAHTLNLEVIAEGVETEDQFTLLYDMGCNYFQGWYCGRPAPLPSVQ